jgi:glycerophosphoryl diester phosphodiesterase
MNQAYAKIIDYEPQRRLNMDLIAHRGDSQYAPENTLIAFEQARDKGASCVEFDVMLTQDAELIVFHDETLDRTTNGRGRVDEHSLQAIQSLDAGQWFNPRFTGTRVPTFVETMACLGHVGLDANIEIKPCGNTAIQTAEATCQLLKAHWPAHQKKPLLSSFNWDCLGLSLEVAPEYPRGLLLDRWRGDCCILATQYACFSIHVPYRAVTSARVDLIKRAGFRVYVYTVNTQKRASKLAAIGVDAIFSDNPRLLLSNP